MDISESLLRSAYPATSADIFGTISKKYGTSYCPERIAKSSQLPVKIACNAKISKARRRLGVFVEGLASTLLLRLLLCQRMQKLCAARVRRRIRMERYGRNALTADPSCLFQVAVYLSKVQRFAVAEPREKRFARRGGKRLDTPSVGRSAGESSARESGPLCQDKPPPRQPRFNISAESPGTVLPHPPTTVRDHGKSGAMDGTNGSVARRLPSHLRRVTLHEHAVTIWLLVYMLFPLKYSPIEGVAVRYWLPPSPGAAKRVA